MYTMAPEDYFKLWVEQERRCADGWAPAATKRGSRAIVTMPGRLRRLLVAVRSAALHW